MQKVSVELDEELGIQMESYRGEKLHFAGFVFLSFASFCILPIICYWRPEYYCWIACIRTSNADAEIILVKG